MDAKKPSVLLIGGLPRPSGGVTVFLGRLVNSVGHDVDFHVLDIHPGEKEPTAARSLKIAPRKRWLRALWMAWQITKFRGDIIHFNYSGCHALMALALLPKFGRKFFLTLHNGSQIKIFQNLSAGNRQLVRIGSEKVDCAFSLCEDHSLLYHRLGMDASRIVHTKSQIAAPNVAPAFVDERHADLRKQFRHLVISSGHVSRSYNFEFLIRFVNEHGDCAGILFFYGEHVDECYLEELKSQMKNPAQFAIYFHQSEATFLSALATANAYLRPTHVDSWGIAVADAVAMGVPAIASNVCERATGAILVQPENYDHFENKVQAALSSHQKKKNELRVTADKIIKSKYLDTFPRD